MTEPMTKERLAEITTNRRVLLGTGDAVDELLAEVQRLRAANAMLHAELEALYEANGLG